MSGHTHSFYCLFYLKMVELNKKRGMIHERL